MDCTCKLHLPCGPQSVPKSVGQLLAVSQSLGKLLSLVRLLSLLSLVSCSISHSVSQSGTQLYSQSVSCSISHSVCQSVSQLVGTCKTVAHTGSYLVTKLIC